MQSNGSFLYRIIQGAVGKRLVIKHYRYGVVVSRYPTMGGIVPSEKQKVKRRLFRKAVAYAKKVYAHVRLREESRRRLRKPRRLFQALMKEWYGKRKEQAVKQHQRVEQWRQNITANSLGRIRILPPLPIALLRIQASPPQAAVP